MTLCIKNLLKRWAPPILADWYLALKQGMPFRRYIWEGVYQNYCDVPVAGDGYEGDRLTQETLVYTRSLLAPSYRHLFIPIEVVGQHVFLPMLVSTLNLDSVSILDFGGGMGVDYIHLISSIPNNILINYHIVENSSVCEAGARLFENDPKIHFYPSVPTDLTTVDIVYICTALQYVEDYDSLLKRLSNYRPKYFLFVKLAAGDNPTYASIQRNLPGTKVGHWFLNVQEIVSLMSGNGYSLIYKSALEREYDQGNFPAEYRVKRHCNLLFRILGDK